MLHPTWSTYSGSIMVATIGTGLNFDQLFLNSQQQVLARYPNYNAKVAILNGYGSSSDVLSKARIARWHTPTTGFVRALQCSAWGGESYKITGVSNGNAVLTWVGDNNRGNCIDNSHMIVENIFEELDTANEWFYNKTTGKLYFWPPAGTNMSTAKFETASLDELIHVAGTSSQNPVRYLTFSGFTFTEAHRTLFDTPYEGLQLGDWAIARAGAVHIKNAENITVENSFFNQLGGNGVFIDGYNSNDLITQNQFANDGATDVQVVGSSAAVRDHSTWSHEVKTLTDTTAGPKTNDYPRGITISYNDMYNMGRFEKEAAGVVYAGSGWTWDNASSGGSGSYVNDVYATHTVGDSFSLTFNGTGIDMVTEKHSDEGQIAIYIDGVLKQTINCAQSTRAYQQAVYSVTGLSTGQHTIKGVMKTGTYMIVDAFNVHG